MNNYVERQGKERVEARQQNKECGNEIVNGRGTGIGSQS